MRREEVRGQEDVHVRERCEGQRADEQHTRLLPIKPGRHSLGLEPQKLAQGECTDRDGDEAGDRVDEERAGRAEPEQQRWDDEHRPGEAGDTVGEAERIETEQALQEPVQHDGHDGEEDRADPCDDGGGRFDVEQIANRLGDRQSHPDQHETDHRGRHGRTAEQLRGRVDARELRDLAREQVLDAAERKRDKREEGKHRRDVSVDL